jgi:hypothetical protein
MKKKMLIMSMMMMISIIVMMMVVYPPPLLLKLMWMLRGSKLEFQAELAEARAAQLITSEAIMELHRQISDADLEAKAEDGGANIKEQVDLQVQELQLELARAREREAELVGEKTYLYSEVDRQISDLNGTIIEMKEAQALSVVALAALEVDFLDKGSFVLFSSVAAPLQFFGSSTSYPLYLRILFPLPLNSRVFTLQAELAAEKLAREEAEAQLAAAGARTIEQDLQMSRLADEAHQLRVSAPTLAPMLTEGSGLNLPLGEENKSFGKAENQATGKVAEIFTIPSLIASRKCFGHFHSPLTVHFH